MQAAATDLPPRSIRWLLLAAFALLVLTRMPEIVLKGRFWAEEGQHFFAVARTRPPLEVLLAPFGGYLNLVANVAGLAAARLMPLAAAPYLTIAVGLAFQLLPPWLLLTARDRWLAPLRVRIAGLLLVLLVPASEEIWLQTLHCQFELTLACGIVLALRTGTGAASLVRLSILLLAPLCGPGAIALVPLFLARAAIERSGPRLVQGAALASASAIQLALFVQPYAGRAYGLDPALLMGVITVRHLVEPLAGLRVAYWVGHAIQASLASGRVPPWAVLPPALVFAPLAGLMLVARRPGTGHETPAPWLLAASALTALVSYFGALGGLAVLIPAQSGERYVVVPQSLLALSILALAATATRRVSTFGWVVVAWLIVVGAGSFESTLRPVRNGPAWRDEIAAWERDPARPIALWPRGWTVTLAAQGRAPGQGPDRAP